MRRVVLFSLCLLLGACALQKPAEPVDQEVRHPVTEDETPIDPEHGREVWFGIGPIASAGDTPANGVVQAHIFEDGQSVIVAQVNIEVSADGFHYEGWLLGSSGDLVHAGVFDNPEGNVQHQLRSEIPQDLKLYPTFLVTLETDEDDKRSGTAVAQAALVHRER